MPNSSNQKTNSVTDGEIFLFHLVGAERLDMTIAEDQVRLPAMAERDMISPSSIPVPLGNKRICIGRIYKPHHTCEQVQAS